MNAIISLINQQLYPPNQKLNTVMLIKCLEYIRFSDESFEISLGYSYLKYQMGNECFIQSLKHYRHSNEAKSIAIFFDYVTTQKNISCVFDYILDKVF